MIPKLCSLNLSYIRLTNNSLRTIARYCPLLEKIIFKECFCDSIVEKGLEILFKKCPNIKYLDFSGNDKLNGESFVHLPFGIINNKLENCFNVPPNVIENFYINHQQWPNLQLPLFSDE